MAVSTFYLRDGNVIAEEAAAAARSVDFTTTEGSIVLDTDHYAVRGKKVIIQGDGDAWGISDKTGAFATKFPLANGQYMEVSMNKGQQTFYIQASTGTVTIRVWVVGNAL